MFVLAAAGRTIETVESELVELAAKLERGLACWLDLVAEFEALGGARAAGFRCTSDWIAWRFGLHPRTAREHVRVARSLSEMPRTMSAFREGSLSFSKVRAVTRAHGREDEVELLELARTSTAAQLEARLRALPSSPSADPDIERRVYESRFVDWRQDEYGGVHLSAYLPADDGAVLIDAVDTGAEAIHPAPGTAERHAPRTEAGLWGRPPLLARRADALAEILRSGAPPNAQIVIHASESALCAIEGGPAIPPATAQRIACDATIVRAGTAPGDFGRRMRLPTPAMRNALERRDQGCRFPGCTRRHGLSPHHAQHWAHGGATSMDNQAMFCRFHHRLFHEEGFTVRQDGPVVTIHAPDGTVIPEVPRPGRPPPSEAAA